MLRVRNTPWDFRHKTVSIKSSLGSCCLISAYVSCGNFIAEQDLDNDHLRRRLHESCLRPVIKIRRRWKDEPVGESQKQTRQLCENRVNTMVYNESGNGCCVGP